jgi:hypothetical protein
MRLIKMFAGYGAVSFTIKPNGDTRKKQISDNHIKQNNNEDVLRRLDGSTRCTQPIAKAIPAVISAKDV